jgi:hypothetical protein
MNPPSTIAELLVSQFAPAVLLTIEQVSQITSQAEQTIRNLRSLADSSGRLNVVLTVGWVPTLVAVG